MNVGIDLLGKLITRILGIDAHKVIVGLEGENVFNHLSIVEVLIDVDRLLAVGITLRADSGVLRLGRGSAPDRLRDMQSITGLLVVAHLLDEVGHHKTLLVLLKNLILPNFLLAYS